MQHQPEPHGIEYYRRRIEYGGLVVAPEVCQKPLDLVEFGMLPIKLLGLSQMMEKAGQRDFELHGGRLRRRTA
jgi:hypothetical protein